mmetsp:Transcript_19570/g.40261  ORF Transcript_19570/g.40261 Transcript_19570/m.40261 type:complete len:83 (+) Transcript_19570:1122-1370(+)
MVRQDDARPQGTNPKGNRICQQIKGSQTYCKTKYTNTYYRSTQQSKMLAAVGMNKCECDKNTIESTRCNRVVSQKQKKMLFA